MKPKRVRQSVTTPQFRVLMQDLIGAIPPHHLAVFAVPEGWTDDDALKFGDCADDYLQHYSHIRLLFVARGCQLLRVRKNGNG